MSIEFFARLIGMVVLGAAGIWAGSEMSVALNTPIEAWATIFGLAGMLMGLILTPNLTVRPVRVIRNRLSQISQRTLFAGLMGLILSLIISGLLAYPLSLLPEPFGGILPIASAAFFGYLGVAVFVSRRDEIFNALDTVPGRISPVEKSANGKGPIRPILMDTSVIIDGRIADIARTGFLSGELLIPRFVLNELQYIADSGDNLRRQRGRRGLEVLAALQKDPVIPVRISDIDVEGSRAVDDKLIILARQMRAPVLTNDFNLNRVAELQGVSILNINDLANAVKAVYLPGENLNVRIIQEGREANQGVGYLDDGTMVVVQDGQNFIGVELDTVVTKVLQTAAGRMIFAKPENE